MILIKMFVDLKALSSVQSSCLFSYAGAHVGIIPLTYTQRKTLQMANITNFYVFLHPAVRSLSGGFMTKYIERKKQSEIYVDGLHNFSFPATYTVLNVSEIYT